MDNRMATTVPPGLIPLSRSWRHGPYEYYAVQGDTFLGGGGGVTEGSKAWCSCMSKSDIQARTDFYSSLCQLLQAEAFISIKACDAIYLSIYLYISKIVYPRGYSIWRKGGTYVILPEGVLEETAGSI